MCWGWSEYEFLSDALRNSPASTQRKGENEQRELVAIGRELVVTWNWGLKGMSRVYDG